jgi:hypothetical protein
MMTLEIKELEIIKRFQKSAPVDVGQIAEALGLGLWESSNLSDGVSGKLMRDPANGGKSGYSIIVNSADAHVRKRFTVAHEIAHYILHRDLIGNELVDDSLFRSGLTTSEEAQANRLAADILMPRHLLNEIAPAPFDKSPEFLSKRFQVSEQAMRIRLGLPPL